MVEPELAAIAQKPQEVAGRAAAGNDHDLRDSCPAERFERIVDHRLVVDRQQMLVGDLRQRPKPLSKTPGEDNAFHHPGLSLYQATISASPRSKSRLGAQPSWCALLQSRA